MKKTNRTWGKISPVLSYYLKMKLATLLFLFTLIQTNANFLYGQKDKISLEMKNVGLDKVLTRIESQTDYRFVYKDDEIEYSRIVSVNVEDSPVKQVLKILFENSSITFHISGNQIVLKSGKTGTPKNTGKVEGYGETVQKTVHGRVVSEDDGLPLPGVAIMIKGTDRGVVTDFDGNFSIEAAPDEVLRISYIGFETLEVPVNGRKEINITLKMDAEELSEVVVVGYGTQKRSDITGAISSVKSEDLEDNVITSVGEALQGRVSGVMVTRDSGEPGSGININIRGINSISGSNEPLYILDGIPLAFDVQAEGPLEFSRTNPLASLNPNDIESIEILKDASATAIYGSRASNGVVLITTKSAIPGKTTIEASVRTSVSNVETSYDLMNARQYAEVRNYWTQLDRPQQPYEELLENGLLPYDGRDKRHPLPENAGEGSDFIDALYRTSYSQNIQLAVSGGTARHAQRLSVNYDNDEGVIINSKLNRANLRYNSKLQLTDRFKLTSNIRLNYLKNRRVQTGSMQGLSGVTFMAMRINPFTPINDPDTGELYDVDLDQTAIVNPVVNAKHMDNVVENKDVILGMEGNYELSKVLTLNTRLGLNHRVGGTSIFGNSRTSYGRNVNGKALLTDLERTAVTAEVFLHANKQLKRDRIYGVLGVAYEDITTSRERSLYSDFTFDDLGVDALQLASTVSSYRTGKSNYTIQSAFYRLNYAINRGKYLFTVNGRLDGTSKFINGQPWGFFPSGAISWVAHKERFIRNLNVFSQLKFRVSYGETGSQFGVGPLATQGVYAIDKVPLFDDNPYTATFPAGISNTQLTWETSKTLNLGLNLGILKNRLRANIDVYKRNTERLLTNLKIPSQTGFNTAPVNAGELENKGIEVELFYNVFDNKKFKWNTSLNWTKNKTTVVNLGLNDFLDGPSLPIFTIPGSRTYPGQELGLFYGYNVVGLIQPDDLVDYENGNFDIRSVPGVDENGNEIQVPLYPTTGGGPGNNRPGMWIFEDTNEDGVINIEDRKVLGNPNPDFFFGWNNNFTFGNFDLNIFIQGSFGNDILNLNKAFIGSGWQHSNGTKEWYQNRWTLENQHNNIDWPSGQIPNVVDVPTSVYIEDGSYVRLKNLTLRYNLKNIDGLDNASIFFTGTNLFTITNYSGPDPEVNMSGASPLARGVDVTAYPRPKIFSLGLKLQW